LQYIGSLFPEIIRLYLETFKKAYFQAKIAFSTDFPSDAWIGVAAYRNAVDRTVWLP